jgi:ATP-binding cassette subfamily A (ABC1) protein 3
MNTFDSLCGKFGDADVSNPSAYSRYGSVYINLLIQIVFLGLILGLYEYSSVEWLRRKIHRKHIPLHYAVKSMETADAPGETVMG